MNEKTGHIDINGNWVDETPQAKIRNKLTPFWTLSSIISEEKYDKNKPEIVNIIERLSNTCESLKDEILQLIAETENIKNEKSYSEDEVIEHLNHLNMMPSSQLDKFTDEEEMITSKWFKQFKK